MAESWTKVDYDVAMEVASHEAIVRQAYKDSVDKWTWSVGLTSATGHNVERYIGRPQSLEHCLEIYVWALDNYADQVRKVFAGHKLTKAQFAAALSFHWNTGAISTSTWALRWKKGDIDGAREAFMWYRKPKSIIPRRERERDLFFDGVWHNDGRMTEYTRVTKRSTPDWSSAKKIDVETELRAIFADPVTIKPHLDQSPQPFNIPGTPTLSPEGQWHGALAAICAAIGAWLKEQANG